MFIGIQRKRIATVAKAIAIGVSRHSAHSVRKRRRRPCITVIVVVIIQVVPGCRRRRRHRALGRLISESSRLPVAPIMMASDVLRRKSQIATPTFDVSLV
jgi:hypothetical protein